jgi:arylsulfatase A-like enzyme
MLADDMGYGELSCLNPQHGRIQTPHLDSLAKAGMVFTDAHGGSSVCTPTRYGLLTGRYAWRTRLQSGVLTGGPSLIQPGRATLATMLGDAGYMTAIIGKWHLGMLFDGEHLKGKVPVGARVTEGPIDRGGFDLFKGFHHARQIEVWIENDRVTEQIAGIEMLPRLERAAVEYIHQQAKTDQPFFLYVPWNSPHSPVVPSQEWKGKSGLNEHADFVMQTDAAFGSVVEALRATGQLENTLIICSADNGTSAPTSKAEQLRELGHYSSGHLRGMKADIWDGGHRVPFIAHWPEKIRPGSTYAGLTSFTDLFATLADIAGVEFPAAEDSISFADAFDGTTKSHRTSMVQHSVSGYFAYRLGKWKLCLCPGSGGWTKPKPSKKSWEATSDAAHGCLVQLYNLERDAAESSNLAEEQPALVAELLAQLQADIERGHTVEGLAGKNDTEVNVFKAPKGIRAAELIPAWIHSNLTTIESEEAP